MRQEQRREWNKANARKSRLRKKFMGETLLTRVDLLRDQNDMIKSALAQRGLLAAFTTWSAAGGHAADLVPADDAMRRTGEDSMAYRRIMSALDSVRDAKHDYDSSGDTALVAVPHANKKAVHVVPHTAVVLVQPAGAASTTTSEAPDSAQGSSVLTGGGAGSRAGAPGPSRGRVLASVSTAPSSAAHTDGGTGTTGTGTGSEETYQAKGAAAVAAPPAVHTHRLPAPFRAPSGPVLMLVPSPRADHARKSGAGGTGGGKSAHWKYDLEELEDDEYEEDGMEDEDEEEDDDELYSRRPSARAGSMGEGGVYPGLQGRPVLVRHAQDSSPDQDGPEEDEMISDDDRELISKAQTDAEHEGSITSFLTTTTRTSNPRQPPSAMVRLCPQDYELMQLVASAQQHFIIADATVSDNPIAFASQGFHTLTGYSRDEILGFNCRFLQGPGTDPSTVARIRAAVTTGRDVRAVILNYTKAGQPFWNELFIAPLKDSSGKSVHFVGVQKAIPAEQARRLLAAEALAREHEGQGEGALQKATGHPAIRDTPERAAAAAKASVALASRSSAMRAQPGIAVQVKR